MLQQVKTLQIKMKFYCYCCIVFTVIMAFALLSVYAYSSQVIIDKYHTTTVKSNSKKQQLELLKNALLAFSLRKVFADRFEEGPISTNKDDTLLPPMSGSDTLMACFSYIVDKDEFRKCVFYTPTMAQKHQRVDDFLAKNLGTKEQIQQFFKDFIEEVSQHDVVDQKK